MSALAIDGFTAGGDSSRGARRTPSTGRLRLVTGTPARPAQRPARRVGRSGPVRGPQRVGRSRGVAAPSLGAPVPLVARRRRAITRLDITRPDGVQLTERGMLAVLIVFGVLAVASAVVIVASFFAVSNAPIDGPVGSPVAGAAVGG